jgi:hypothetical protein
MRTVTERPSFQGDLMIRRIAAIPATARRAEPTDGHHILAHSETGHHHVIGSRSAQKLIDATNDLIAYLDVASPDVIKHLRDFDTHEPILLTPGTYEIRRQREYVAEGFRRVED